jgi:hypothetical protein
MGKLKLIRPSREIGVLVRLIGILTELCGSAALTAYFDNFDVKNGTICVAEYGSARGEKVHRSSTT